MKKILISFIKAYRFLISPLLGQNCRFHPTCSAYAIEAINNHGVLKGFWLGICRIMKCHPYYKGGMIDPVPKGASKVPAKDCTTPSDRV